jgi:hypothetical protein
MIRTRTYFGTNRSTPLVIFEIILEDIPDEVPKWNYTTDAQVVDAKGDPVHIELRTSMKNPVIGIQTWWWTVSAHFPSELASPPKDKWLELTKDSLTKAIQQSRSNRPAVAGAALPVVAPGAAPPHVPSSLSHDFDKGIRRSVSDYKTLRHPTIARS